MKVKLEVELDTDKETDLNMIQDLMDQLDDFRDILEAKQQNLNKRTNNKQRK